MRIHDDKGKFVKGNPKGARNKKRSNSEKKSMHFLIISLMR